MVLHHHVARGLLDEALLRLRPAQTAVRVRASPRLTSARDCAPCSDGEAAEVTTPVALLFVVLAAESGAVRKATLSC